MDDRHYFNATVLQILMLGPCFTWILPVGPSPHLYKLHSALYFITARMPALRLGNGVKKISYFLVFNVPSEGAVASCFECCVLKTLLYQSYQGKSFKVIVFCYLSWSSDK